jgi:hypothetical protein
VIALVVVALAGQRASAEPEIAPSPTPLPQEHVHAHDPNKAANLSLYGTLASLAVTGVGIGLLWRYNSDAQTAAGTGVLLVGFSSLAITPGLGHSYGEHRWFTPGMWVRLAGFTAGAAVATWVLSNCSDSCAAWSVGLGVMTAGIPVLIGATMDVATARSATERFNAKHDLSVSVAPMVLRTPSNTTVGGLGITGRF